MPTATKSPSQALAKLKAERDEAFAEVQKTKRSIAAFVEETEAMRAAMSARVASHPEDFEGGDKRVKPGTTAAKLSIEIKQRMGEPAPDQAELDGSIARFHALDQTVNDYKRSNVGERLAELDADHEAADRDLREGFALLEQGCKLYGSNVEATRAILSDTPGIERGVISALGFDPRPAEWLRLAREVGEVARPGITEYAAWKVAQHG